MACSQRKCPDCKDRLIHQSKRGQDESSSAFGQYVRDEFGKSFDWVDVDGVIFKVDSRMLRIVEHKPRGGSLSEAQQTIMPLLAAGVRSLVTQELVHPESGVFVVRSDPPFEHNQVRRYRHWRGYVDAPTEMSGTRWHSFVTGEVVDDAAEAAS